METVRPAQIVFSNDFKSMFETRPRKQGSVAGNTLPLTASDDEKHLSPQSDAHQGYAFWTV
jgi:hypothetical protein